MTYLVIIQIVKKKNTQKHLPCNKYIRLSIYYNNFQITIRYNNDVIDPITKYLSDENVISCMFSWLSSFPYLGGDKVNVAATSVLFYLGG